MNSKTGTLSPVSKKQYLVKEKPDHFLIFSGEGVGCAALRKCTRTGCVLSAKANQCEDQCRNPLTAQKLHAQDTVRQYQVERGVCDQKGQICLERKSNIHLIVAHSAFDIDGGGCAFTGPVHMNILPGTRRFECKCPAGEPCVTWKEFNLLVEHVFSDHDTSEVYSEVQLWL